jgi:hypothetical protein
MEAGEIYEHQIISDLAGPFPQEDCITDINRKSLNSMYLMKFFVVLLTPCWQIRE